MNARAIKYRELHSIPFRKAGARQRMCRPWLFGNMGETSATGVAFTRNPRPCEVKLYGEFLLNAQGEDVVAGFRTPQDITEAARIAAGSTKPSLETSLPEAYSELVRSMVCSRSIIVTCRTSNSRSSRASSGCLQTRNGKRTAKAALRIAVDLASEG